MTFDVREYYSRGFTVPTPELMARRASYNRAALAEAERLMADLGVTSISFDDVDESLKKKGILNPDAVPEEA